MDILRHGHLGQIVQCHVMAVLKDVNENLFLIRLSVTLKLKNESVIQVNAQVGVNGDPGVVVQKNVGNLADQNQTKLDIDAGKWPTVPKIVVQEKLNQARVNYVVGLVQNYAMKKSNAVAIQEKISRFVDDIDIGDECFYNFVTNINVIIFCTIFSKSKFKSIKKVCLVQNRVNGPNGQITVQLVHQIAKRAFESVEEKTMKMKECFKNFT